MLALMQACCRYYNATQESQEELDMKAALRRGDKTTLNVYLGGWTDLNLTAWSTLPWEIDPVVFPGSLEYDGVVINQAALPGGNAPFNWNKGKTVSEASAPRARPLLLILARR